MQYDPIKRSLGNVFNKSPFLRKTFYNLLDLLLLRAWHVHKELRAWKKARPTLAKGGLNSLPSEGSGEAVSVLDAGAGFGQYTYWLHKHNPSWKILSVDVKDEQ